MKPNSVYPKPDYTSLLVKASILDGYAEETGNVSRRLLVATRKRSRGTAPTSETALSCFRSIDRYELLSVASIVFEEQADELKGKGPLLNKPVLIALDWHDQMFYMDRDSAMVNGTKEKEDSSYTY